jgi:ribosomal protein L19
MNYIDNLSYFYKKKEQKLSFTSLYIKKRKNRDLIKFTKWRKFVVGDVLEFVYFYKTIPLIFSGICIAIKRKNFILPDVVIVLRNIILKTAIEITVSYFYNRIYTLKFLDYKRKIFTFNKNKLFFIRKRVNRESRVG